VKLCFVRWLDACYQDGERQVSEIDPRCELTYCGFLVKETSEAVTLSLEAVHEGRTRNPFSIRRENIIEMRTRQVNGVFRRKKQESNIDQGTGTASNSHQK
jgi:hypothetical protein